MAANGSHASLIFRSLAAARLTGKVAVVTGGSKGIGYAVAKILIGEGCNVVISATRSADAEK